MIPGLYINDLLEYAEKNIYLKPYLPDEIDWLKVDRKWLCDMIYTLDNQPFRTYITKCVEAKRKKKVEAEKNMTENASEFAIALKNSVVFSCKYLRNIQMVGLGGDSFCDFSCKERLSHGALFN